MRIVPVVIDVNKQDGCWYACRGRADQQLTELARVIRETFDVG